MTKTGGIYLGGLGILMLVLAGCATGPTRLEAAHGSAFHAAKANQTLNPEAGQNLEPVEGFDGEAARATIDHYRENFAKPKPPPTFAISVGSVK